MKAARTARKLGASVALAEERVLGGECFWAGCVPSKAMVRAAQVWHLVHNSAEFGIHAEGIRGSFAEAMAYKDRKVREVGGEASDEEVLHRIGVRYFHDRAQFLDPHTLQIGAHEIHADRIIIATGTVPSVPPVPGLVETGFITNREAVDLTELPKSLIVLGGGPIGLEFAQVFRRFGSEVTVVEIAPQILPNEDREIADLAAEYLSAEGIRILTGSRAACVEALDGRKQVYVESGEDSEMLIGDEILVATGRDAAIGDLNLEAACVDYSRKAIHTNQFLQTSQPHIWVAGDVAGGYLFTHVASFEGRLAAENALSGDPTPYNPRVVPRATFVDPEIASVGLTEAEALGAGLHVAIHTFKMADLDRAILHGDARGMVKLVVDARSLEILGGHLIGPECSAVIAEIMLAMQHHLPVTAISATIHAYPTFAEAVEAAALSSPIH